MVSWQYGTKVFCKTVFTTRLQLYPVYLTSMPLYSIQCSWCLVMCQVYLILDEFICGGEIQETAKKVSRAMNPAYCNLQAEVCPEDLLCIMAAALGTGAVQNNGRADGQVSVAAMHNRQ